VIENLAILAPGLLGASIAKAARKQNAARFISLWARKPAARAVHKNQSAVLGGIPSGDSGNRASAVALIFQIKKCRNLFYGTTHNTNTAIVITE
jgi:hypothetical protein